MLVVRDYKFGDGSVRSEIDPDYERRYREMLMQTSAHPGWQQDDTYDLKNRKRNK